MAGGATPLFVAALKGHVGVVRFLVESGANKDQSQRDDGATPLHAAAQKGRIDVVRFLVSLVPTKTKARQMEQRLCFKQL